MRSWNELWLVTAVAAAMLFGGCIGNSEDRVGASRSHLDGAAPLPIIEQGAWTQAHAGCEGQVEPGVQLGVAEGAPSLVGVLDETGYVVCVDTFDAIEQDLIRMGAGETVERIRRRYLVTSSNYETLMGTADEGGSGADSAGDPSPQPNLPQGSFVGIRLIGQLSVDDTSSDPSPQPNDDGPTEGDPSPQPN